MAHVGRHSFDEAKQVEYELDCNPIEQALHDEVYTLLCESEGTNYWTKYAIDSNHENPTLEFTRMYLSEDANTKSRVLSPFLYNLIPQDGIPCQPTSADEDQWKVFIGAVEKYFYQILLNVKNTVLMGESITLKPEIKLAFQKYLIDSGMDEGDAVRYMDDTKTPFRIYEFFYSAVMFTITQQSLLNPEHTIFYGFLSDRSTSYDIYQDDQNICMQHTKASWGSIYSESSKRHSSVDFLLAKLKVYFLSDPMGHLDLGFLEIRRGLERDLVAPPGDFETKQANWVEKAKSPLAKRNLIEVFMLIKHIHGVVKILEGCINASKLNSAVPIDKVYSDSAKLLSIVGVFLELADNEQLERMLFDGRGVIKNMHDFIDGLIFPKENANDLYKLADVFVKIPAISRCEDAIQKTYADIYGIQHNTLKLKSVAEPVVRGDAAVAKKNQRGRVDSLDLRPNPIIIANPLMFNKPKLSNRSKILIALAVLAVIVVIGVVCVLVPPVIPALILAAKFIGIKSVFTHALTHASAFSSAAAAATKVALGLFSAAIVGSTLGVAGGFAAGVKKLFGKCFGRKKGESNDYEPVLTNSPVSSVTGSPTGSQSRANGSSKVPGGGPLPGLPIQGAVYHVWDKTSNPQADAAAAGAGSGASRVPGPVTAPFAPV